MSYIQPSLVKNIIPSGVFSHENFQNLGNVAKGALLIVAGFSLFLSIVAPPDECTVIIKPKKIVRNDISSESDQFNAFLHYFIK